MTLDQAHNLAAAAGLQAASALFSSNPEVQGLAQAVSSLSQAIIELVEHERGGS